MAQQIKKFVAKTEALNSIPSTHIVDRTNSHKLFPDFRMYSMNYTHQVKRNKRQKKLYTEMK